MSAVCPGCTSPNLRDHCPRNATTKARKCDWLKCTSCRTTYDPLNKRAYDASGQPVIIH